MSLKSARDTYAACVCRRAQKDIVRFTDMINAASRTSPCRLCALIVRIVETCLEDGLANSVERKLRAGRNSRTFEFVAVFLRYKRQSPQECCLEIRGPMGSPFHVYCDIDIFQSSEEHAQLQVDGHIFPSDFPFGQRAFDYKFHKVSMWLRECLETHGCGELSQERILKFPKRLLDVSRSDCIRLFETEGTKRPYVTLSHCWGDPKFRRIISTVSTLERHKKNIPWESIPQTFQHVIIICQRLHIRYLWIDTLCILQQHDTLTEAQRKETELDFANENSAMADIYEGSYFTISADTSTSMDSGIFSNSSSPPCLPVKIVDDSGKPATLFARTHKLVHGLQPSGIDTRSWTLQEHILPRRVLHFGTYDITWRCRELNTCECGYVNDPDRRLNGFRERQNKVARELPQLLQPASNVIRWWESVIESYSHRNLSEPRDKLPALSGLAQVYRKATADTYLAGLWKGWLPHGLCWSIGHRTSPGFDLFAVGYRPKTFRAPSWSWASIDISRTDFECQICSCFANGTDIEPKSYRLTCMLHEVYCTPKTSDLTGEVSEDCRLEIGVKLVSATVKRLRLQFTSPQWTIYNVQDGTEVQYFMPDCKLEDESLDDGDEVFCAPIMESLDNKYSVRRCILLKRLKGHAYQRVGFCVLLKENPNAIEHEELEVDAWQMGQESPVPLSEETARKTKDYALQFNVDMFERIVII